VAYRDAGQGREQERELWLPVSGAVPIEQDVQVPRSSEMCGSGQVIARDGMYAGFAGAKTGHGGMVLGEGFIIRILS